MKYTYDKKSNKLTQLNNLNRPIFNGAHGYAEWEIGEYNIDLARYNKHIENLKTLDCDESCKGKIIDGEIVEEGIDFKLMDSNKYYRCECDKCGWSDSSEFAAGGGQIADTGDYGDAVYPVCHNNDIDADSDSYKGIFAIPISKGNQEMKIKESIW